MPNHLNQRHSSQITLRRPIQKALHRANILQEVEITQPAVVRFCHWGFAFSLLVVLLTGFVLHKPPSFLAIEYGQVYIYHVTAAWLSLSFAALRTADALIRRDRSLLARGKDFPGFLKLLSYYLYFRNTPPPQGKYNSGQRLIFTSWILVFILASFLGFVSYFQGEHLKWTIGLLDGLQTLRYIKFGAAIYFTATIPIHIYLSLTENPSKLQAMISGSERRHP